VRHIDRDAAAVALCALAGLVYPPESAPGEDLRRFAVACAAGGLVCDARRPVCGDGSGGALGFVREDGVLRLTNVRIADPQEAN
jgi:hypothetical protein